MNIISDNDAAIAQLRLYVEPAEPEINRELRDGICPKHEVELLESLYSNSTPAILYRVLPLRCVDINDGYIQDKAFLSTSGCFDDYIFKSGSDKDIACLQIKTNGIPSIHVAHLLPDHPNENEYILPCNLQLRILEKIIYTTPHDYAVLLADVECATTSVQELAKDFDSITLLRVRT